MGIAEKKQLHIMFHDLLFKISQIDMIPVIVPQDQVIADDHTVIVPDHLGKWIVDRLLDQYAVTGLCERLYRHCQGKYHARSLDQPVLFDLPVMMPFHPSCHRVKIYFLGIAVTKDSMFCPLDQRILHVGRCLEIHVCHPEREDVRRLSSPLCKVIFQAVHSAPFDDLIKIQISLCHAEILSSFRVSDPISIP